MDHEKNIWLPTVTSESRISVPARLFAKLSGVQGTEFPAVWNALVIQLGRVAVLPPTDDIVLTGVWDTRQDQPTRTALSQIEESQLAAPLILSEAKMEKPTPTTYRLTISRTLWPVLDVLDDQRQLYMTEFSGRLELRSVKQTILGLSLLTDSLFRDRQ